jgi:tetratricopeptide (TPR) repeat protein
MSNFLKSLFGGKSEQNAGQENHKNFEIFKYDGLRAQRMGRLDYAAKCFNEALAIEEDFETLGYLSQLYIQTNELDKAHDLLVRMTELEPSLPDSFIALANLCYIQNRYDEMEKAAQKAVENNPESAVAYYLLAKAVKEGGNDIMCIAHLTKAVSLKPDFVEALLLRAEVLMNMQQLTEAAKDVEAALEAAPDDESAVLMNGRLKETQGKIDEAEQCYRQVIEGNPFSEQAFVSLGQLYIGQKRITDAIFLFDEAIELNPEFAKAYFERGRAKLLNGDKEGAMEDSRKAMELQPKAEEALNGMFGNNAPQQEQGINILGI